MNEMTLLDTYGPDGPQLSVEALQQARRRLLAEVSAAAADGSVHPRRRRLVARVAVAAAGVAVLVAATLAVMPDTTARAPGGRSVTADAATQPGAAGRIRLVAATAPQFPYSLPGLGTPSFTADPGGPVIAVYPAADGSDVVLTTNTPNESQREPGVRDVTVDGRPGRLVSLFGGSGTVVAVQLTWERQPGRWVTIVGNGRYASEQAVLRLASTVVDRPQRISFKLTVGLVPLGWQLGGFKDGGTIITYLDPAAPSHSLSARWTPQPETPRDSDVEGFQASQTVTVNGRPAHLVRAVQFWRLTTALADGSGLMMLAPRLFSADQVIAVAGSVRVNHS